MQVDDALVDKLARLSMLRFDEAEKEAIQQDLTRMIGFIDQLRALDTTGVIPLLHMSTARDVLREDQPGGMLTTTEALKNAPRHDEQFFLVPKVIKKA